MGRENQLCGHVRVRSGLGEGESFVVTMRCGLGKFLGCFVEVVNMDPEEAEEVAKVAFQIQQADRDCNTQNFANQN